MATKQALALIGAGHWGKNLARNFHALGALRMICDTRQQLLDGYQKDYPSIALTTDFEAALGHPDITQIAIAAPATEHYTLAKHALLAGKDVFVEKPLCLKAQEAQELVELAREHSLVLMVGHLLQYHPAVRRLQEIASSGMLGKIQYISSHRLSLGQIRTAENNLWSFAPHDLSAILSLLGNSLPTHVRCVGQECISPGVADMTITSLEFSGGIRAHIYTSWLHPFKEQKLVVVGSAGMAVFDDTKAWEEKLTLIRQPIEWVDGLTPKAQKSEAEKIQIQAQEPLQEECLHFLTCCRDRATPKSDGNEGVRVLQVLEAAQKSLSLNGERCSLLDAPAPFFVHESSYIDPSAIIGKGTKIWHFSHIMGGALLGDECNIGQNVVVSPGASLGNNVKVQNNVSIYTGVVCEDDVFLGPSMVFTNVMNPRSSVNRRSEYQATILRQGTTVGANATIVCGVELGAYCFIGAGAVVTKNVKPFALMVGSPAKQVGWMSRHGERLELPLHSETEMSAICPATGETYLLTGDRLELISPAPLSLSL